jgi:DNA-directed RNA polymerase subunit K/omega
MWLSLEVDVGLEVLEHYNVYPRMVKDITVGPPRLTKYEKARIIGVRALQLAHGAPPLVPLEVVGSSDPVLIAKYEVENGILPLSILRYTSSGVRQSIPLSFLIKVSKEVLGRVD